MSRSDPVREVDHLLSDLQDGRLSDSAAQKRLVELLAESDEACDRYLDQMAMHAMLEREFGGKLPELNLPLAEATNADAREASNPLLALSQAAEAVPAGAAPVPAVRSAPSVRKESEWWRQPWPVNLAAAAALTLVTFGAIYLSMVFLERKPHVPVAQLLMTSDEVSWRMEEPDAYPPSIGQRLYPGVLKLEKGLAHLAFASGAEVTIEGPAVVDLRSPVWAQLDRGKLSAEVPIQAHGFTVSTPSADVVDLGTRFGIEVTDSGEAEVHVFQGLVRLDPPDQKGKGTEVRENAAVRVTAAGKPLEQRMIEPLRFRHDLTVDGIVHTSPGLRMLRPAPASVVAGALEDHEYLVIYREKAGVKLPAALTVFPSAPGVHNAFTRTHELKAGVRVDSYLIHCDPPGEPGEKQKVFLSGSVTFERPILGILVTHEGLVSSDEWFGSPTTRYGKATDRGLEAGEGRQIQDGIILSPDRKTLTLSTQTSTATDQVRILVAAEKKEAAP